MSSSWPQVSLRSVAQCVLKRISDLQKHQKHFKRCQENILQTTPRKHGLSMSLHLAACYVYHIHHI